MKIICTICARGGSKGVQSKNSRMIAGYPLIVHSIRQALDSELFEHVVISTDSDEISEISRQYGGEVFFRRPGELAEDSSPKLPVIRHAFLEAEKHYGCRYEYIVDLDATSPLRSITDIQTCADLIQSGNCSNVITAAPSHRSPYFNLIEKNAAGHWAPSKSMGRMLTRRQESPPCFDMNASIYAWTRESLLNESEIFLPGTQLHVMPRERSFDIDSPLDFRIVELLMREEMDNA